MHEKVGKTFQVIGVAVANHSGAIEIRDHFKNGASLKSQMSKVNKKNEIIMMVYKKPVIVAENKAEGTFAAACPEENSHICRSCESVM